MGHASRAWRPLLAIVLLGVGVLPVPSQPASAATAALSPVRTFETPWFGRQFTQGTPELFSSPAVGDVDGDGNPDVVAGFLDGHVYGWHTDGSLFLNVDTGAGGVNASPALVDLTGDGVLDIISANTGGRVLAFTGRGSVFFSRVEDCRDLCGFFATPTAADLDRDGQLEIIAASWQQRIYAWNLDGSNVPGWPVWTWDTVWSSPTVADLEGDGSLEVIVGGDSDGVEGQPYPRGGLVFVIKSDGRFAPGWPRFIPNQVVWSTPAVVDITGDNSLDIIVGTGNMFPNQGRFVLAFDRYGTPLPGWPAPVGGSATGSPAVADVDGDGSPDVATVAEDGKIYVHDRYGQLLPGWPQCVFFFACPAPVHGSVTIADVDNDGQQEVIAPGARVFSRTGALEAGPSLPAGDTVAASTPTVTSVGGQTWIVQGGTHDVNFDNRPEFGRVYVFTTQTPLGGGGWRMFKNNVRRTGTWFDDEPPTVSMDALASSQSSTSFTAGWLGSDAGTGVARFDVDVQDGNGPWVHWLVGRAPIYVVPPQASGHFTFFGLPGHTYNFRARATDKAGNTGEWSALASTAIAGSATRAQPFSAAYAVNGFGDVSSLDSPPVAYPFWPGWDIGRGLGVTSDGLGGYVLDGYGGLHPFGTARGVVGGAYWRGWDIARGLALLGDGSGGLVMDAWGGLHPFGAAVRPAGGPYWRGWAIARDIVLLPRSTPADPAGYILDGFGGLHAFGSAPPARVGGYWRGWDIARGATVNPDGLGGYVLDGFGGLHPFAVGAEAFPAAPRVGGYWRGWDIATAVASFGTRSAPAGYVLDGFGGVHPFGAATLPTATRYWGFDIAKEVVVQP